MAGVLLHSAVSIAGLLRAFFVAEQTAARAGILQQIRAREKLLGSSALVAGVVVTRRPLVLLALAVIPFALAFASSVPIRSLLARSVLVPAASVVVVLPQAFLMPGPSLVDALGASVSTTGVVYVLAFTLRVWLGVALLSLVVMTTPFSEVVAALRDLRVPVTLVWTIALTYRYLFLLVSELGRLALARESRAFGERRLRDSWRDLGRLCGTFFLRTIERGERVHLGMVARGGSRPPSPYPSTGTVGRADVGFVVLGAAVFACAGVIRWVG